jgi:hypothetical protein
MEHLLFECMHYVLSTYLGVCLGKVITQYLNSVSQEHILRVEISVIYIVPHLSILLHICAKHTRNALLILTQKIKCDII